MIEVLFENFAVTSNTVQGTAIKAYAPKVKIRKWEYGPV